jgi:glycosyltransferase involved in cell wall biosynthesis
MRKVCFVTNYNYDKYLPFCLDSLLNQSVKFDVIYVVDDGSTDRSRSIINEYAESFREIVPLFKDNGGQLSCFNFVSDYITEEDFVWCIDSDDYYPSDYIDLFLDKKRGTTSDFYFCREALFSAEAEVPKTSFLEAKPVINIGLSAQITRLTKCWIGSPTSGIALSGRLFKIVLPYPFEKQWVTRADDVIIYASSLCGYSKTFIPSLCFGYRTHGANNYYGQVFNKGYKKKRLKSLDTLFSWYTNQNGSGTRNIYASILKEYNSISSAEYRKDMNISFHRLLKKYFLKKIFSVPKTFNKQLNTY